jgi:urease accessory protein
MTGQLVVLLHLCDSLFPIGSFAHSDGLEAATTEGRIESAEDLRAWMDATLSETLRWLEGPAVARAWQAFTNDEYEAIAALDDELHAFRPSSSGREATRAMGGRLVRTWQQIRPSNAVERLLSERTTFTLPVAFGVVSAASSIPARAAVEGFMYTRLAAMVSTAMRLMPIGQQKGHTLLAHALCEVPALAGAVLADAAPLRSFTPMLDTMAMTQQYGQSRLFRS